MAVGTVYSGIQWQIQEYGNNEAIFQDASGNLFCLLERTDASAIGIARSTDGGVTWGAPVSKTAELAGAGWLGISGVKVGDDIHVVYGRFDYPTPFDCGLYYAKFDMSANAWVSSPSLPATIATDADAAEHTTYTAQTQAIYAGGEIVILYWINDEADPLIAHAAPTDSSWTTGLDPGTYGGARALFLSSDSTLVHVNMETGIRTLDTADWTFSTAFNPNGTNEKVGYFNKHSQYVGHDGSDGWTVHIMTTSVTDDGDTQVRRIAEDANGELTSTGIETVLITTNNVDIRDWGGVVTDDVENPGHVYLFYDTSYLGGAGTVWRLSEDYGETWGDPTTITTPGDHAWSNFLLFTHSSGNGGDRVIGMLDYDQNTAIYYDELVIEIGAVVESEIRPIADDAAAFWETAPSASQPLFEQVDEVTPSDTDYVYAEDPNP